MEEVLKNILLVEDDPDIQEIAVLSLNTVGGFNVETCSSGKEALEKLSQSSPQLILLDVMMPDMDGPTTLEKLRALPPHSDTPVIFLTAKIQSHEVEKYKKLGAIDVISKPFDPIKLPELIRSIWKR